MSYSRRTLSLATVILIFAALATGVWWRLRDGSEGEGGEAPEGAFPAAATGPDGLPHPTSAAAFSADAPQPVVGAEVIRDTLWIRVRAAGQAEARRRATLTAQVEGEVRSVEVRENDLVSAGAALVEIDTTEYTLAVAQAEADLRAAEAEYRQMTLFDDRIEDAEVRAQRERIARARSGLEQRRVALEQARLRLARARVSAPFGGRVGDLRVVEGQWVSPGTELLTLVELDPIWVQVHVLEAQLGLLAQGRRAEVRFAAYPGETFVGRVQTVNPLVDPETRTGRVTVVLENPGHRIKPGMYAEVALDAQAFPDRILVPRAAVLERGIGVRRHMVFVYKPRDERSGLAEWRYVNLGRENDDYIEIVREGPENGMLEPGEIVLVDGHHYLAHDTPVRLVEDVAAAGGRPGR